MKSNRSIKTTGLRHGIAFLSALLLTSGGLSAGVIKITTSPSFDSNNNVFIRPNQSVTFSASASNTKDTIKSWAWTFTTGSPATADVQNPTGPIAFSSSAGYGQANDCYVGVSTTGTNGETCTASDKTPLAHVYVNVLTGTHSVTKTQPSDCPGSLKAATPSTQYNDLLWTQSAITPSKVPSSVTWHFTRAARSAEWSKKDGVWTKTYDASNPNDGPIAGYQDDNLTSAQNLFVTDAPGMSKTDLPSATQV